MLTPDEALYALLCKYLLKEADSIEQRWVNTWLQANSEHPVLLASLDKLLSTAPEQAVAGGMDTETAWRMLSERMELQRKGGGMDHRGMIGENGVTGEESVSGGEGVNGKESVSSRVDGSDSLELNNGMTHNESSQPKAPAKTLTRWMAAAAAVFLLISAGLWYIMHQNERQINYNGAQLVKLDDGTSIQLDPAAQLQVAPGFGKKDRKVILKGKATFDVTTDASHPFIIDLGNQAITVLGTRFSVDNSSQLRVFIHSGKVKVTHQQDSVILTAGMLLQEDTSKQYFQVGAHISDVETRAVVFKDTPLREVLQTIHVLYHINVTADAALLELPVTGTYTGEPVKNVLDAIAYSTNANVINKGADYELRPQD
ncbi:FecR family protein [Chitinophaga sp. LS1]|uniref:FecR family protein n=1 Tax=Chitinophaga sp. LS1 TaxID=3051176 RepID=UPI002AAAB722|nr:FecR domain-containing protein [Chitinophaga sp. LS1]WPV67657.1 FecR domain-containing protein [Chitinophaga sp. LS1]